MTIQQESAYDYDFNYRNLSVEVYSMSSTRDLVETPEFWKYKRDGIRPPCNPYSASTFVERDELHEMQFKQAGVPRTGRDNLKRFGGIPALPTVSNLSADDLKAKLADKVNESEFNAALAYLERGDTASMISSRCATLYRAAKHLKRGNFSGAAKAFRTTNRRLPRDRGQLSIDEFSNYWLEFRYGWTPLLSDIYSAADLISAETNKARTRLISTSAKVRDHFTSLPVLDGQLYGSGYTEQKRGIGIYVDLIDPEYQVLDALGLTDPATVGWELTPFSFVVDWFVPVGDALRSMTAFQGLTFLDGYEYEKLSSKFVVEDYYVPQQLAQNLEPVTASREQVSFNRTVLGSFDDLRISPFQLRAKVNLVRALDGVTLLHGFLKANSPKPRVQN